MSKNKQEIKFEADVTGFKSAIKDATAQITSLNKELKLNQAQMKNNKNDTNLLQEQIKTLDEEYKKQKEIVENTQEAYARAVDLLGENSEETKKWANRLTDAQTKQEKIKTALNEANEQLKKQTDVLNNLGESWKKAGDKITKVGDKLGKIGTGLTAASAGVTAIAGASVKVAIDYESAFAGVAKTVDATDEQLQQLSDGILEMSTRMPAAATEIAGVAESAGQLGIKTENILSFSEAMIGLGEATNLTADEASSQLAKFANIMGMSQNDFDKLGSSIVDLGNHFATTEADIVAMAMRLAGAGKQVGLSEGQVLGLATALSSVGIEAEMGGSAISKAMVKMQNAVELGGGKMETVLKKAGMSLHEMELLAANSPKDFKALAGSLDMTSTELKNMITAGTNLEDFAKVSGMTAEQFKKAWKEDAAGALSAFIQGLGHAEDKGESAITMLSEMGLTEVRLRDSLLRAANAGDLFNNAIETGTAAWKENTALANEVNKRYATTESQMKMLKNEAIKLGVEFGNELAPSLRDLLKQAKPLLSKIAEAIKKFSDLDSKTKQNTIKIVALTTAIGPLLKIAGTTLSTGGRIISGLGKMNTNISSLTANVKVGQRSLSNYVSGFQTFAIAATAAYAATELVVAGVQIATNVYTQDLTKLKDYTQEIKNEKQALEDLKASKETELSTNLTMIEGYKSLWDELKIITDENGKIKEGYEDRANYIVTKLNSALGTEIEINGNVIQSYKEIQNQIDQTILKAKASAIMTSKQELYTKATEELIECQKKLAEEEQNLVEQEKKVSDARNELTSATTLYQQSRAKLNYDKELNKMSEIQTSINETKNIIKDSQDIVTEYDYDLQLMTTNTAESLEEMVERNKVSLSKDTDTATQEITTQINLLNEKINRYREYYNKATEIQDEANAKMYNNQIENDKKTIEELANKLKSMTSATQELTPEQIEAWKAVASASVVVYSNTLAEMPETTRAKIEEATGIVATTVNLQSASSELGTETASAFDQSNQMSNSTMNMITAASTTMNNNTDKTYQAGKLLAEVGIDGIETVDYKEKGSSIATDLKTGLESQKSKMEDAGSSLGNSFMSTFKSITKTGTITGLISTIKGSHADGLAYVPYNGYVARLHEGERILTKKENENYIRNNIDNRSSNIVVNFYLQEMTDDELNRAYKYINRKWGVRA